MLIADPRVQLVSRSVSGQDVAARLAAAWKVILDEIDLYPIFSLARQIVLELTGNPNSDEALRHLAASAMRITTKRAALRHDLMGRIYHRLLADAKYFGAFYTTVPAATLLVGTLLSIHSATHELERPRPYS